MQRSRSIEYNELLTGDRNEALIFSVRPFMAKLSSSLQQIIIMVVYLAIGLTDITNGISAAENAAITDPSVWTVEYKAEYIKNILAGASSGMTFALRCVMAVLPVSMSFQKNIKLTKKNTTEFYRKLKTETNKPESASRLQNAAIGMCFLFSSYLYI